MDALGQREQHQEGLRVLETGSEFQQNHAQSLGDFEQDVSQDWMKKDQSSASFPGRTPGCPEPILDHVH